MIATNGPVQLYVFRPDNKSLKTAAADCAAGILLLKMQAIGLFTHEGLAGFLVYVTVT